jgi:hypothetical protein
VALINEVFTGATGKTKFARASHDIVFIESTHIFPSYHDALERFQLEAGRDLQKRIFNKKHTIYCVGKAIFFNI